MYDVFISYRQIEPDRSVAAALQKRLESYRTPGDLVRRGVSARLQRVFLDRSELAASSDLAHELVAALEQSRYLVVVCSPRTPESQWMAREVDIFRARHGDERILLLLIEGEPAQAYPVALRAGPNHPEPLAADIRAPTLRESVRRLQREESLRLLAPILGVGFDDLYQRERRRLRQRRWTAGLAAVVVAAVLAGLTLNAQRQSRNREEVEAIGRLTDRAVQLSGQGQRGLAAALALQAWRLDEANRHGLRERVEAALRLAVAAPGFNQTLLTTDGVPNALALSDDGKWMAVAEDDGSVQWLDMTQAAAPPARWPGGERSVKALAFVPGTRTLLLGMDDGEVLKSSMEGERLTSEPVGRCRAMGASMVVHPTGQWLAVAAAGSGVCLLSLAQPQAPSQQRAMDGVVRALAFSGDGRWLAAARRGAVSVFATDSRDISATAVDLPLPGETATAVAFGAEHLIVGSNGDLGERLQKELQTPDAPDSQAPTARLRLWPLAPLGSAPLTVAITAHRIQAVATQAIRGHGTLVAVASTDGPLWLVDEAQPQHQPVELPGVAQMATALAFLPDGRHLLSTGLDHAVRLWRLNDPAQGTLPESGRVAELAFLDRDILAVVARFAHQLEVWDLRSVPLAQRLAGAGADVRVPGNLLSLAIDPAQPGRLALGTGSELGGSVENAVRLWSWRTGQFPAEPLFSLTAAVHRLAFGGDGRWLAAAGEAGHELNLWDTRGGMLRRVALPQGMGTIRALALHPRADPPQVAMGAGGWLLVFNAETEQFVRLPLADAAQQDAAVEDLAFGPDGSWLASAASDGGVRRWRTRDWHPFSTALREPDGAGLGAARRLAVNPVTGELAVGHLNGAVRVWSTQDSAAQSTTLMVGEGKAVVGLAFDPSGTTLAVARAGQGVSLHSTLPALVAQGCQDWLKDPSATEWMNHGSRTLQAPRPCPR